jgi:serine/threonine-protein kinase
MDTTVADSLLGALIDGRYRVRARVARGGMATVYTAVDERLERVVALKIIHPAQADDPRFVDRFIDEAKTIARLTHPNVVAVYDQGTHQALPYLVMEYVRGRTLRDVLADRRRLQPQEALAILEQVLAAVAAAHRAGLVHRDVKPENVLVAEAPGGSANSIVDGVVKVADFGLARAVERSADEGEGAGSHLLATAAYVAPELVTDGHADPRTDVYSAGIVLFEMLTGRVPYDGDRPVEVAWQHVQHDVPPPSRYVPTLPPVIDELVARATRRDPGGRPTDAGAMLAEVQSAREDVGFSVSTRAAPLAGPTVTVPQVDTTTYRGGGDATARVPRVTDERPAWSRLPSGRPRPGPRRSAGRGPGLNLAGLINRVNAHPRGRLAVAAALVVVGLLAAVGGWWFGIGRYTEAPSLLDKTKVQAEQEAREFGFKIKYAEPRYDEKKAKDLVLSQEPPPGERIVGGGTVTLTLSRGPERINIPDVVGKQVDLALDDLTQAKLVPERSDVYDDLIPKDVVIRTDPPAGGTVSPGTKITVYVSKGRAPITLPRVVGQNVDQARAALQGLGLEVAITEKESDKPAGEVIDQNPIEGASAEKGAKVTLTVSKGPPLVNLPDTRGLAAQAARQQLEQLGFRVRIFGNENGVVVIQNPPGGQLPKGTEVNLLCT